MGKSESASIFKSWFKFLPRSTVNDSISVCAALDVQLKLPWDVGFGRWYLRFAHHWLCNGLWLTGINVTQYRYIQYQPRKCHCPSPHALYRCHNVLKIFCFKAAPPSMDGFALAPYVSSVYNLFTEYNWQKHYRTWPYRKIKFNVEASLIINRTVKRICNRSVVNNIGAFHYNLY